MTRFGVMKHLRVLEAAGLVTSRKVGRERHHYLNPVPIRRIHDRWLDRYRIRAADLLDDLRTALEATDDCADADGAGCRPPRTSSPTFIRATPEHIWQALTDSEFTLQYYYSSTVHVRLGRRRAVRVPDQRATRRSRARSSSPTRRAGSS